MKDEIFLKWCSIFTRLKNEKKIKDLFGIKIIFAI